MSLYLHKYIDNFCFLSRVETENNMLMNVSSKYFLFMCLFVSLGSKSVVQHFPTRAQPKAIQTNVFLSVRESISLSSRQIN